MSDPETGIVTIGGSSTVETGQSIPEIWASMRERYNPISWCEEFPRTTIELHIPNPEKLIDYGSEQLVLALRTAQDLQELVWDISLLTSISEANNIEIRPGSPLYRVVLKMSRIPNNKFEHLQYPEIYILAETAERAAKLLPEAEEGTESHILKGRLLDLADKANEFVRPVMSTDGDHDYEDELEDGEGPHYFSPHSFVTFPGEERHYNNTYIVYDGENPLFPKYNIGKDDKGNTYFKSCGIFVLVEQSTLANMEFTPFDAHSPDEIDPRIAVAMAYRGMKNFLHAIEQHQLGNDNLTTLSGTTNPTMALFASRFGFKIGVDGEWLSKEEIKARGVELDNRPSYWVVGRIEDIRRELERFEQEGFGEKLVRYFNKNPNLHL